MARPRPFFFDGGAADAPPSWWTSARARGAEKRGGDAIKLTLDETLEVSDERSGALIALDDALDVLAGFDERRSQVVELRFFGGLSVEETASVLKVSPQTVMRDWKLAKTWLLNELGGKHAL